MVTIAARCLTDSAALKTDPTELIDIVDHNDHVIGTATRGEIHQRELMHRSVHIIVLDGAGNVLLQKRSMQKDQCAGMWDTSCAGHVDSGQNYAETAPRELHEELGIHSDTSLQELFKMRPTKDNGQEFAVVYTLEHQGPFTPADDEIDELQWYSFSEVDDWLENMSLVNRSKQDLTSGFMEIWRRFRAEDA